MSGTTTSQKAIGVVAGIIVAAVVVGIIEAMGFRIYPLPAGMDMSDPADVRRLIEVMTPAAKSVILGAWFLGALIGGWVAMTVAKWRPAPWIVSASVIIGGIWSMVMIPHPLWMMAAGVLLPLLAAMLVSRRTVAA